MLCTKRQIGLALGGKRKVKKKDYQSSFIYGT